MSTGIELQITFLIYMFLTGVFTAFLYDIVRASRVVFNTSNVFVYAEDIIFLVLAAFIIFRTAFRYNNGKIQFFDFGAMLVGVFLYIFTIRNRILNLLLSIVRFFKKIVLFIFKIVAFPIKTMFKIFKGPYLVIIWRVKKTSGILKIQKSRIKNRIKATKLSIFKK